MNKKEPQQKLFQKKLFFRIQSLTCQKKNQMVLNGRADDWFVKYLNDSCLFLTTHVDACRKKIKIISINNR